MTAVCGSVRTLFRMLLEGKSGDRFELKLLGYQFPEATDDEHDGNWLTIQVTADTVSGSWTANDPSLLTSEVALLALWLRTIAHEQESETELDFLEPNLSFELVERGREHVRLRVWFELELRPELEAE